jgi:hypothetical protein
MAAASRQKNTRRPEEALKCPVRLVQKKEAGLRKDTRASGEKAPVKDYIPAIGCIDSARKNPLSPERAADNRSSIPVPVLSSRDRDPFAGGPRREARAGSPGRGACWTGSLLDRQRMQRGRGRWDWGGVVSQSRQKFNEGLVGSSEASTTVETSRRSRTAVLFVKRLRDAADAAC